MSARLCRCRKQQTSRTSAIGHATPFFYPSGPTIVSPLSRSDRLIHDNPVKHASHPYFGIKIFDDLESYFIALGQFRNQWYKDSGRQSGWGIEYALRVFYDSYFSVAKDCYDRDYKPRRFNEHTNPLRLVEMNTTEGVLESNRFRNRAWEYRTYKINELMGMSFLEWISLPTVYLDMLLEDIRNEARDQLQHQQRQAKEIEQMNLDGPVHPDQQSSYLQHLSNTSKALR